MLFNLILNDGNIEKTTKKNCKRTGIKKKGLKSDRKNQIKNLKKTIKIIPNKIEKIIKTKFDIER